MSGLLVHYDDDVVWVTLDRPAAANTIGLALAQELGELVGSLGSARVLVIQAAGAAFCGGGDLRDRRRPPRAGRPRRC